jgi:hypothetical protein
MTRGVWAFFLVSLCAGAAGAQDSPPTPTLFPRPPASSVPDTKIAAAPPAPSETVPLTVPKGMAVQVALDEEVRVRKVGQPLTAHTVEPIYAFDKLVIPTGTAVQGRITKIQDISNGKRTLDALNAEFTPAHKIDVEFTELVFADGKRLPIHTRVTRGSGEVVQFVTAADDSESKSVKEAAAEKARQAKEEAKREWDAAMEQVKEPGKAHKIERYAVAQLPIHPQYITAGTLYFAELEEPLDFGIEPLTPELAASLSSPPPDGSFVRARLVTPLSSATSQKGDEVEAMLSRPLFDGDRLILPQGALLKGSVIQVEPAHHLSRNGQLRFVFHDLVLPSGLDQKVNAVLAGVEAGKSGDLKLDSEGGAQAQTPKTRYLQTGIAIGLAALASSGDGDADVSNKAAGGAGGFKLIGIAVGIAARSQPLGIAMGVLGASRSIYIHFVARGREVVFPENTAMQIGVGVRPSSPGAPAQE